MTCRVPWSSFSFTYSSDFPIRDDTSQAAKSPGIKERLFQALLSPRLPLSVAVYRALVPLNIYLLDNDRVCPEYGVVSDSRQPGDQSTHGLCPKGGLEVLGHKNE